MDDGLTVNDDPTMKEQRAVARFVDANGLEAPPEFRLVDLVSEVGEVAKNATESTAYGAVGRDRGRVAPLAGRSARREPPPGSVQYDRGSPRTRSLR